MCSRPVKGYDADFGVFLVEQQPVGIDVALPVAFVVAMQQMVVVLWRQSLTFAQHVNDHEQLLHVEPSAHGQFHVAVVLLVSLNVSTAS